MGGRPEKPFRPLLGYTPNFEQTVRSIDLIKVVVKKASTEKLWIYDPSAKRWYSPEEFMDMYERYDNLDVKWIKGLEVKDPSEGLKAADDYIENMLSRRRAFEQRIIEYWKGKCK